MISMINKNRFIRFLFIGGLNTLFAYLIIALFLFLDFHYTLATLFSAIISIYSGYLLNKHFVFNSVKSKNIFLYYIYWFIMYNLNIFIQFLLLKYFYSENLYLNSFISTAIIAILSFFINRYYFFKE